MDKKNSKAVAALVCGAGALVCLSGDFFFDFLEHLFLFVGPLAFGGIFFGISALKGKKAKERNILTVCAIVGLLCSILALAALIYTMVIVTMIAYEMLEN